jgi:hypothetical protein
MKILPASREDEKNALVRRRSLCFRAALALVLAPAITAYCVWMVQSVAQRGFQRSTAGRIVQLYNSVAPQVEQREKDIEELTR